MPTLKGAWKFNEVLTNLPANMTVNVSFETRWIPTGDVICSAINIVPNEYDEEHNALVKYVMVSPTEETVSVYFELGNAWGGDEARQISFIGEQEVPSDFYEWFTNNAVQPSANIYYKGEVLGSVFRGEYTIANTSGRWIEDNIRVEVPITEGSNKPIEIPTASKMTTFLDTEKTGSVCKYVGETTDKYENGVLYIICEEE